MIERSIWRALKSRIETVPINWPQALPGESYTPDGNPYIRVGKVSAAPARLMLKGGRQNRRDGFIILTLVMPLGMMDSEQSYQSGGAVAKHFVDGTTMESGGVKVLVTDYPNVMDGYEDGGYWNVNVRIPWQTLA